MNAQIRNHDGIGNDFLYRRYLQDHATAIMRYNTTIATSRVAHASTACKCEDADLGNRTPYLYRSTPYSDPHYQASDLKSGYLRSVH